MHTTLSTCSLTVCLLLLFSLCSCNQMIAPLHTPDEPSRMDNKQLGEILASTCPDLEGGNGQWQMTHNGRRIICLTDESNDRMRFISPITKTEEMTADDLAKCMGANFHRALDARYGISDGMLWAAFIHPLSPLSKKSILDGLEQTSTLANNYGTTYSSGSLSFGGQ